MTAYKMRTLTLLLSLGLIFGCVDSKKVSLKQEINQLQHKFDSLKVFNDSLTKSKPFLFESALSSEKINIDVSKEIYKRILALNETDIWTALAEDRLLKLTENEKQPLKEIFQLGDTLILSHHNDKCGEWGGDGEIIKIYFKPDNKKGFNKGDLFAVYQLNKYDCAALERNPDKAKPTVYISGHKKLSYEFAKIAEECIFDLLKHKLTNDNIICASGVTNTVELKGSAAFIKSPSIFIDDYPSFSWTRFHLLKNELTK